MSVLLRRAVTAAALATGLALMPATAHAAPGPIVNGPYAGQVAQGETDTYTFDNHPRDGSACLALATWYNVSVTWVPASDTLTLNAGGESVTASGGYASVRFMSGICTSFGIWVTGTVVADKATYAVRIQSGMLAGELADAVAIGDPGVLG